MAGIVSDIGKGLWKALRPAQKTETKIETTDVSHGVLTFAVIYANDLAKMVIEKEIANFPVGSIIVREKRETATSETPQSVIAMVKRERGFSKETNDWEFFSFEAKDFKLRKRETTGDCAKCHIQAEKTDWIFRDYLR